MVRYIKFYMCIWIIMFEVFVLGKEYVRVRWLVMWVVLVLLLVFIFIMNFIKMV